MWSSVQGFDIVFYHKSWCILFCILLCKAEQLASVQYTLPKTAGETSDFWRFRGLRSSRRNLRKSKKVFRPTSPDQVPRRMRGWFFEKSSLFLPTSLY